MFMARRVDLRKRRQAILANLMGQLGRSPEMTRLMILLIVWGNVRARSGYTTHNERPARTGTRARRGQRRKSFTLKRPRQRFL
jgi:hypothetical protein